MEPSIPPPVAASPLAPVKRADGTALAALVLAILGFLGIGPFGWIPGIVCGHIARGNIRRDPSLDGDGMAVAGLVISYIGMALLLAVIVSVVLVFFMRTAAMPHPRAIIILP